MTPNNNLVGIGILPTFGGNNAEIPKAYLIAQFYNADNQPTQRKVLYITSANYAWSNLGEIQEIALENGRVEIFVANESNTKVYFDDLSIYKSPTPIVQENHYYPFGMNLVGIEKEGTPNHRFQFMGKEKESSFGLNWTETDWRGYDGQVGRFWQVDKLAEQAPDWTAYRYGFNNPISHTDPSGLFEEINLGKGKGVDKNLELYLKELENSGRLGERKGGTKDPDPPTRKFKTVNVTGKKWTKKDEFNYQLEQRKKRDREMIVGAVVWIGKEASGLNDLAESKSSFEKGHYMAGIFYLGVATPWGKFGKLSKFKNIKHVDEVEELGGGKIGGEIAELISEKASAYSLFKCVDCANDLVSTLKKNGLSGQIIEINTTSTHKMNANIWSDRIRGNISTNGTHMGVLFNGKVYDNLNPKGIGYDDWIKDFFSPTGFNITKTDF